MECPRIFLHRSQTVACLTQKREIPAVLFWWRLDNSVVTRQATGRLLLGVALFCSTLIYARTLRFDFVYDDGNQIVRNPHLESAAFIPIYFSADVWSQFHTAGEGRYYRPVFLLWLLLNRTLFGITPAGWHAASLSLELLAISLLYVVATKLLKDPLGGGIAALVFAVHPANLETVAWVSSSSELLMGVLLLLAFFFYLRFRDGGQDLNLAASVLMFALALGSKETALVFLALLVWHEWFSPHLANEIEQGHTIKKQWKVLIGPLAMYLLAGLLYLLLRAGALRENTFGSEHQVTLGVALLTIPSAVIFYIRHLIFPIGLAEFYDVSYTRTVFSLNFALTLLVVVSVAALLWVLSRRVSMGRNILGWIFLPLLPALAGLRVFTHADLVHDRYLYISTMGFAMFFAAVIIQVKENGWQRRVAQFLPFVVAGAFVLLTVTQLGYWKDNLTLYQRDTQVSPRSFLAFDTLANERLRGKDLKGAVSAYKQSLAIEPNSWTTNMALGLTLVEMGTMPRRSLITLARLRLTRRIPINTSTWHKLRTMKHFLAMRSRPWFAGLRSLTICPNFILNLVRCSKDGAISRELDSSTSARSRWTREKAPPRLAYPLLS